MEGRRKPANPAGNWHARLEETRELWSNHICFWQASGLSQAEFCRQKQLKPRQFLYWKKRILGNSTPATSPIFTELPLSKIFRNRDMSFPAFLRLELHSRYRIEIERGFDPGTLLELIRVLDRACSV
jgi:hypothetical protein